MLNQFSPTMWVPGIFPLVALITCHWAQLLKSSTTAQVTTLETKTTHDLGITGELGANHSIVIVPSK